MALHHDTVITSAWATRRWSSTAWTPRTCRAAVRAPPELLEHVPADLTQRVDRGDAPQLVLELRPAHDPTKALGIGRGGDQRRGPVGSIFLGPQDGDRWAARQAITIPAEPADPELLPRPCSPWGPCPLVSDIDLSVDDRWLSGSCWDTGELTQYDVADPFHPRQTGSVRLGGSTRRQAPRPPPTSGWAAAPQLVEIRRDGRRG